MTGPAWFNSLSVLIGIVMIIMAFSVYGTISDRVNENLNRELVTIAIDQNNKQLSESNNIERILQAQGNLTSDQRQKLITALGENVELVPKVQKALTEIENKSEQMLNATNEMYNFTRFISESFDKEYLIDEVRQYGQSNFTESQIPVILDKLDTLLNKTQ